MRTIVPHGWNDPDQAFWREALPWRGRTRRACNLLPPATCCLRIPSSWSTWRMTKGDRPNPAASQGDRSPAPAGRRRDRFLFRVPPEHALELAADPCRFPEFNPFVRVPAPCGGWRRWATSTTSSLASAASPGLNCRCAPDTAAAGRRVRLPRPTNPPLGRSRVGERERPGILTLPRIGVGPPCRQPVGRLISCHGWA